MFKDLPQIKKHAKPVDFWTVNFSYFFSFRFVSLIQHTPITPDMLTWGSFLICLVGAGFFFIFPNNYLWWITSGILFQISYILDCADGQLARYKKQFSTNGWRIDLYTDRLKELAIFTTMSYALSTAVNRFWLVGMAAMALYVMLKYVNLQEVLKSTSFSTDLNGRLPDLAKVARRRKKLNRIKGVKSKFNLGLMNIGEFYFFNFVSILLGRIEYFFYAIIGYSLFSIIYHLMLNVTNEMYFRINFARFREEGKDLVVFGTGAGSRQLIAGLLDQNIKIAYLCDNNPEKWGEFLMGLMVKAPAELKNDIGKINILIASAWWYEITEQLKSYGYQEDQLLAVYN